MFNEPKIITKDIILKLCDSIPGFDDLWRKSKPLNKAIANRKIESLIESVTESMYQEIVELEKQIAAGE